MNTPTPTPSRTELELRAQQRILPQLREGGVTPALLASLERWAHIIEKSSSLNQNKVRTP